jgi:hypothetical protein
LEKLACGRFSDISSAAAGKRRGFRRLRRATIQAAQVRQAANREYGHSPQRGMVGLRHRLARERHRVVIGVSGLASSGDPGFP